jgi:hypothetical protein
VIIPVLDGIGIDLSNIVSTQNNNPLNPFGDADFNGDTVKGSLSSSGYYLGNEHDFYQTVVLSFVGAMSVQGMLGGNGTVQTNWYNGRDANDDYSVDFRLANGFVTALATPECLTWAMMILGFGAIGGAMRRERQRIALRSMPA